MVSSPGKRIVKSQINANGRYTVLILKGWPNSIRTVGKQSHCSRRWDSFCPAVGVYRREMCWRCSCTWIILDWTAHSSLHFHPNQTSSLLAPLRPQRPSVCIPNTRVILAQYWWTYTAPFAWGFFSRNDILESQLSSYVRIYWERNFFKGKWKAFNNTSTLLYTAKIEYK